MEVMSSSDPRPSTLLRALISLQAAGAFGQAVTAGMILSGQPVMKIHEGMSHGIMTVALVQTLAAAWVWRAGRLAGWVAAASLVLLLAEGGQMGLGYTHNLLVHIPLGVGLFGGLTVLLAWAWK